MNTRTGYVIIVLALMFSENAFAQSQSRRSAAQERDAALREVGKRECLQYLNVHRSADRRTSSFPSVCNFKGVQRIFARVDERAIFIACHEFISARNASGGRSVGGVCSEYTMLDIFRNPEATSELARCLDSIDRSTIPPNTTPAEHCRDLYEANHSISSSASRPASSASRRAGARERSNPPHDAVSSGGVGSDSGASYGPAHGAGAID